MVFFAEKGGLVCKWENIVSINWVRNSNIKVIIVNFQENVQVPAKKTTLVKLVKYYNASSWLETKQLNWNYAHYI